MVIPMTRDRHPRDRADQTRSAEPPADPDAYRPGPDHPPRSSGRGRGLFRVFGALVVVAVLLIAVSAVAGWRDLLPSLPNPFAEETTDRSQPVLLRSIRDLSRFTAASGDFEVVIDMETNRRFIPDVLLGERTLFVAAGTVDAYVEFGGLANGALVVDQEQKTVELTLPHPELGPPNLDHDRSYVFAEQRGVVNRIGDLLGGDPDGQQRVFRLAERRIAEAAEASELRERAAANTRQMLEGMLSSLGFEVVTVNFAAP
jgi:hypothetical protein